VYPPPFRDTTVPGKNVELAIMLGIEFTLHEVIVIKRVPFNAKSFMFPITYDNKVVYAMI